MNGAWLPFRIPDAAGGGRGLRLPEVGFKVERVVPNALV